MREAAGVEASYRRRGNCNREGQDTEPGGNGPGDPSARDHEEAQCCKRQERAHEWQYVVRVDE
jgi:hypothetical protein